MPKAAELTHAILCIVADEFEVPADDIVSKRKTAEIVDARHTVIKLMHLNGIYVSRIAHVLGCSARNVNLALTLFDNRLRTNNIVRRNYERARKKLRNIVEEKI